MEAFTKELSLEMGLADSLLNSSIENNKELSDTLNAMDIVTNIQSLMLSKYSEIKDDTSFEEATAILKQVNDSLVIANLRFLSFITHHLIKV